MTMPNPVQLTLSLQHAWINAWLASTTLMLQGWSQVIDLDGDMLRQAGTLIPRCDTIDDGPTFTGKYGRRRFDIDPEHDI